MYDYIIGVQTTPIAEQKHDVLRHCTISHPRHPLSTFLRVTYMILENCG